MIHIYTEITTSYIPGDDITIIWQDMYKTDDEKVTRIQRLVVGWYYGEPNDNSTAFFSQANLACNDVDCEN